MVKKKSAEASGQEGYIEQIGKVFQPKKKIFSYSSLLYEGKFVKLTDSEYSAFGFDRFFATVGFDVMGCNYKSAFKRIPLDEETIKNRQNLLESLVNDDNAYDMVSGLVRSLVSIKTTYEDKISKKVKDFQMFEKATIEYISLENDGCKEFAHLKESIKQIRDSDDYKKTLAFIKILTDNQIVHVVEREMENKIDTSQFPSHDGDIKDLSTKIASLRQRLDSVKFITDFFRNAELNQIHPDAADVLDNDQIDKFFENKLGEFISPTRSRNNDYGSGDFYNDSKRVFVSAYSFIQERLNAFLPSEIDWKGFDHMITGFTNLASFYRRMHEEKIPLCFPKIYPKEDRILSFENLVNLLLYSKKEGDAELITPINYSIDVSKPISIITGPNTGGKTTLLEVVGHLQYASQMGLMWPSRSGDISISDKVAFYKAGNNSQKDKKEGSEKDILLKYTDLMSETFRRSSEYEGRDIIRIMNEKMDSFLENVLNDSKIVNIPSDADGFYLSSLKRFYAEVLPQLSPHSILLIDEFGLGTNTNEVYARSNYIYEIARKSNVRVLHSTHLMELAHAAIEGKIEGASSWGIETSSQGYSTYIPVIDTIGGSNGDRIAAEAGLSQENMKYIVAAITEKGAKKQRILEALARKEAHSGIGR